MQKNVRACETKTTLGRSEVTHQWTEILNPLQVRISSFLRFFRVKVWNIRQKRLPRRTFMQKLFHYMNHSNRTIHGLYNFSSRAPFKLKSIRWNEVHFLALFFASKKNKRKFQGPLHLAKELLSEIPTDEKLLEQWDDLRISFISFLHTVKCAITTNERLIKPERRDYHKNLECNFEQIQAQMLPLLRPHNTYI